VSAADQTDVATGLVSPEHFQMELVERDQCIAELGQWLGAVAERGGCIALIGGEAGIGKTALLEKFSTRQESRVLWGACDALFTPHPLAPLHDIARQTQGPLLAAMKSAANRDVIFSATLDELERGVPSLVVFEDMQWADEATLDLLKFLGRRIHRTRAMLAVTYRDDEVGPRHPLRSVMGDFPRATTHRMLLAPLSEPAVAELARRAARPAKGLHGITGGNPLFVTEVLATDAETVPATVRDAVLARAARLTPAARAIAEVVCVVPGRTEAWLLGQAVPPDEAGIEDCLSIGMVRDDESSLAFRHELARRAFESTLSQSTLQSLHARVLAILARRSDVPPARLAHHANGARDVQAILRLAPLAAAEAASMGAHREAASHYEVALRYADDLGACERALLQEQLSYECYLTDQIERAIEVRRWALEIWRASGTRLREGDTLRWLSRLSWFAGRRAEANQYGNDAVAVLELLPPGPELAMAYSNRAQLQMLAHDVVSAIDWAKRTIELAEPWGNNEILSHALNNLGTARLIAGDTAGWVDLDRSLQLALAGSLHEHAARAYTNLASMAISGRQYARASRHLRDGLTYCEDNDLESWRLYMLSWRARAQFEQGFWQEAGEDAESVLRHSRTATITRVPALIVLGHLRIVRGDPDASGPLEEAGSLVGSIQELQRIGPLAAARAEAAWLAGDRQEVVREAQIAYELAREQGDSWVKGEFAAWLWRAGALAPGEQPADIAEPYALEVAGDLRGAARVWQGLGCPYEHARLLARAGVESEQREALSILEKLGAAPAVRALRKQMRDRGIRGIPRGSRTSTQRNRFGLTRREGEILTLLSEGMRNAAIARRLCLSTKTVDHHVSAILTKLAVSSRAEAVAMAGKQSDEV
jgi:DNA-binding CsgD family transcriptional regulator/tetratricopeptide (TPR) repeat protein